jgi:hypothetical protein
MFRHLCALEHVVQAIVNKANRQLQQEITLEGAQDAFHVHAVLEQTIKDGLAHLVVVLGFGEHILRGVAKGFAATATGLIFAIGEDQPGDCLVNDGAHVARTGANKFAAFATMGARSLLAGTIHGNINTFGCSGIHNLRPPKGW